MANPRSRFPLLAPRSVTLLGGLVLLAACASPNTTLDLATNERLYVDVAFSTRVPGDRELYVAPLVDVRTAAALPAHQQGFPIRYGSDEVWDRPVRDMVDAVLAQVEHSGLFAAVRPRAEPASMVLALWLLVTFTTGAVESISGAQSFADVGLRLRVLGPVDSSGDRPVLLDQTFADRKITEPSLKPMSPYLLIGGALRATVQKALIALDGSNVGRSYVPEELAMPPAAQPAMPPAAPLSPGR